VDFILLSATRKSKSQNGKELTVIVGDAGVQAADQAGQRGAGVRHQQLKVGDLVERAADD
jgi:hypothetical protein